MTRPTVRGIRLLSLLGAFALPLVLATDTPVTSERDTTSDQLHSSGNPEPTGTRGATADGPEVTARTGYRARWAVVIGIDGYPGGAGRLAPLKYAVNDARELRDALRDEFGFAPDRVRYLTDADATLAALRSTFEAWLPAQDIRPDDAVFVFFAGHGLMAPDGGGWLAAVDSTERDGDKSCLGIAWLRQRLAALPCRHKLAILDSCYSGSLFREDPADAPRPQPAAPGKTTPTPDSRGSGATDAGNDNLAYYLGRPAFWGMSAGRYTPVADGNGADRHSVFTAALLQELRDRADSPRPDRAFTFRQLAARVEARVFNALGSRQIPNWGRLGDGDGDFLFRPTTDRPTPTERQELADRRQRHALEMRVAHEAWRLGDVATVLRLLDAQRPPPGRPDVRGFEWHYLRNLCRGTAVECRGAREPVCAVAFSPDGAWVAAVEGEATLSGHGADKPTSVFVWDARTGKAVTTLPGHGGPITCVRFSPDGARLVSASTDGTLRAWDTATWKAAFQAKKLTKPGWRIAFRPDGKRFATADVTDTVRLWTAATGEAAGELPGFDTKVFALSYSTDGTRLVAAGEDHPTTRVRTADADTGKEVKTFQPMRLDLGTNCWDGAVTPDGKWTALALRDRTVRVWDGDGKPVHVLRGHAKPDVSCVTFSADATRLASGGADRAVHLWDVASGEEVANFRGHTGDVGSLAFSADGKRLASGGGDKMVRVWDTTTAQDCRRLSGSRSAAVSPDGRRAVTLERGRLVLHQLTGTGTTRDLTAPSSQPPDPRGLAFAPDGWVAVVGRDALTLRDVDAGREPLALLAKATGVTETFTLVTAKRTEERPATFRGRPAFTRDGGRMAAVIGDAVSVWDIKSGGLLGVVRPPPNKLPVPSAVGAVALTPSGDRVLAGVGRELLLWSVASGQLERKWDAGGPVPALAVSHDGATAFAAVGQVIRQWNLADGTERRPLIGHADEVTALAFTPDGQRLFSGSADATVRTWDVAGGQEVLTLRGHDGPVTGLSVTADGRRLLSVAAPSPGDEERPTGRYVLVWDAPDEVPSAR